MISDHIRKRIVDLRKAKGFTQQELADKIPVDLRTLKRLESGQKKIIHPDLLESIAGALEESILEFLPLDKLGIGTIQNNHGVGIANDKVTFNSTADEIRACYTDIVQQHRTTIDDMQRLSAEKDAMIRELRSEIEKQRRVIETLEARNRIS